MTLKTSLVISGDASGGIKAVEDMNAALTRTGAAATSAAAPIGALDQAQTAAAGSAQDAAAATAALGSAQQQAATSANTLAQASGETKTQQAAVATAAAAATTAQRTYSQTIGQVADESRKLSAANDQVATGSAAIAQQLGGVEGAQASAAAGADLHKQAIVGLNSEIATIVAQVASGTNVFDAMAQQGGAIAAALQLVQNATVGATAGIESTGKSGEDAGVDLGGLGDKAGEVAEKAKDMGGKIGSVASIMAGPWGAAIGIALNFLGGFITGLIEAAQKSGDLSSSSLTLVDALSKEKFATDAARKAIEDYNAQQEKARKSSELATRQSLSEAEAALKIATATREATKAKLEALQARALDPAVAISGTVGAGSNQLSNLSTAAIADSLKEQVTAIAALEQLRRNLLVQVGQKDGEAAADPLKGIDLKYDLQRQAAEKAAASNDKLARSLGDTVKAIELRRAADKKEYEDSQRKEKKPRETSIGDQVQRSQAAEIYRTAQQYTGLSENKASDRDQLGELFAKANVNVDPRMVAWCAAFVNSVLAADGIKGTGSLAARSFLNYGEATEKPVQGDVVVSKRGNNAAQGHVGFYQGTDSKGRVLVLGGNTGDRVGTSAIPQSDVLGFRRAPSAAAQYSEEQKASADALKQQAQDLAQVTSKYLPATQAAKEYADELERIDKLAKSYDPTKAGSGLSADQAERARAAVTAARDKKLAELSQTPEKKAADDAKKSIDDEIASLQKEIATRQAASPVEENMIAHRKELSELAQVDPAAAAAREAELQSLYAQDAALQAIEQSTRAAHQAQEQFRDLALTAFDAIVVRGEKAGDVIKKLAQTIASAAIEATVLGTGPLAALLRGGGAVPGAGPASASPSAAGNQAVADIIGKSVRKPLEDIFGKGSNVGKILQGAGLGYVAGSATGGSGIGGSIGGILGEKVGSKLLSSVLGSFAGPLGSIAGGILGGVVGKLFAPKAQPGGVTVSVSGGEAGVSGTVGSDKAGISAGNSLGGQVASTVNQIVSQLGGTLGDFSVQIGKYKDDLRVNVNGKPLGGVTGSGASSFGDDQNAAVSFAAAQAIAQGAIQGVSAAVAKALKSSTDVEKALKEALKVQDLELTIGGIGAQIDKAFKDFEATAKDRVRIAQAYGFDVVAIEKKNAEDRIKLSDQLLKSQVGSLQSLVTDLTQGSLFEGSALDKITVLNDAIVKAKADLDAGVDGAADTLAGLYQQRLSASKDAYGTTSGYAADREATLDAARAAIAAANAKIAQAANGPSDPALATTNAALAASNASLDEIADQNSRMLAAQQTANGLLASIAGGSGSTSSLNVKQLASYS